MEEEKAVLVLDYDGTIHDTSYIYEPAFRRFMAEITEEGWIAPAAYTSEEIRHWIGYAPRDMWLRFHPELSDARREYAGIRIGEYMQEELLKGNGRLYPQAEKVLQELHESYEIVFLSNCSHDYMMCHRKAFSLDRWFDAFYCTGDYGFCGKEEIVQTKILTPGRRCISIGDRESDIRIAQCCQGQAIGCLYGFGSREELKNADMCVEKITEIPDAAKRLLEK